MTESAGHTVARIGLGTVQWGRSYGIANRSGRPARKEVQEILGLARTHGVQVIDTAWDYGDSERILGQLRAAETFRVTTKTRRITTSHFTVGNKRDVELCFRQSMVRLGQQSVDSVLVHYADDLLSPGGYRLWESLRDWKCSGQARLIGASVYHPDQLNRLLDHFRIDIVQLPFSIYDQRFASSGLLSALRKAGIEVHARSAFLQGALLMAPDTLPDYLMDLAETQRVWWQEAEKRGLSPLAAALGFSLAQPNLDHVIVGCETAAQAKEIFGATTIKTDLQWLTDFAVEDARIIDPSRWPS